MNRSSLFASAAALATLAGAAAAEAQQGGEGAQVTARDICEFGAGQIELTEDDVFASLGELTTNSARIDRDQTEALGSTVVACDGESSGLGGALSWRVAVVDGAPVLFNVSDDSAVYYDLAALQAPQGSDAQISTEEVCDAGAESIMDAREGDLADIDDVATRIFDIDQFESNRYGAPVAYCEGDILLTGARLTWRVMVGEGGLQLIYVGTQSRAYYRIAPDEVAEANAG
ncbi:MAG: hypothetical protein PVI23_03590 [Maricaulaceae bacterium]|jgi:hypothetical protein